MDIIELVDLCLSRSKRIPVARVVTRRVLLIDGTSPQLILVTVHSSFAFYCLLKGVVRRPEAIREGPGA